MNQWMIESMNHSITYSIIPLIKKSNNMFSVFSDDDFDDTEGLDEGYGQDLGYHMIKWVTI